MRLEIRHETVYDYDPAATGLALRLRLFPASTDTQLVRAWSVKINDAPVKPLLTTGYGDAEALWFAQGETDRVEILAEGIVETVGESGVLGKVGRARPGIFLRNTRLTEADDAIRSLAASLTEDGVLPRLHALNETVHATIGYRPGTTGQQTTAAQALAQGAGVCQDLAHVFIAAARSLGIPARYVVGYLHDLEQPVAETHGWAEAHVDGLGWVGFDPTHAMSPAAGYVRLCAGLDAQDAAPLRGSLRAGVAETLSVSVAISETAARQQQ